MLLIQPKKGVFTLTFRSLGGVVVEECEDRKKYLFKETKSGSMVGPVPSQRKGSGFKSPLCQSFFWMAFVCFSCDRVGSAPSTSPQTHIFASGELVTLTLNVGMLACLSAPHPSPGGSWETIFSPYNFNVHTFKLYFYSKLKFKNDKYKLKTLHQSFGFRFDWSALSNCSKVVQVFLRWLSLSWDFFSLSLIRKTQILLKSNNLWI